MEYRCESDIPVKGHLKLRLQSQKLINVSRVSNLTKSVSIEHRLKSWNIEYNLKVEPTIFDPRLKFKPRFKFFKFGLSAFILRLKKISEKYKVVNSS